MFDEFAAGTTDVDADGGEHAAFLAEVGFAVLFVLDVDGEGFALEEDLEVGVVVQDGVGGDLVEHALEGLAAGLDEVGVEASDGLFFGGRGDHDARVVGVQGGVEPEEVAVAAGDGHVGGFVGLGGGLRGQSVGEDGAVEGGRTLVLTW